MAADLQSLFQYWKAFDLISLQKDLDISANELAARQDESEDSRKRLVEFSREFKKTTSEDVRKQVAPLLKNFQLEVDALSKRSKAAEAAFLNVYKKLIDVPDPSPGFEHALVYQKASQKLSDYEIENVKLRETLAEYNTEFAEVKNQEVTIKQLKEKIKDYEQRMDGEVQRQTHEKERELQRQFAEKEKQLHELQLSFAKRLGEAEKQISSLRTALETSQSELFDMKSKFDVSANAKSDEMDLLVADLERANERATLAERQVETLKEQLASLQKDLHAKELKGRDLDTAIDHMKKSNLEFELTTKEREVTQLVEEVHKLQTAAARQQQDSSSRMVRLTEELSKRDQVISELKNALSSQRDYQELQKELQILKSLEFFDANPSADVEQQKNKSLETLLLEKNRTLQNENTRIKNANTELTAEGVKSEPCEASCDAPASVPESERSDFANSQINSAWTENLSHICFPHLDRHKECLDTLEVSNKVKELLSVHNIGQRLFAKHVLGLSQGTVSELLSKPKHWDKLTEKGRESYRKMFLWLQDMKNVDALKNMSPRKTPGPFAVTRQDSPNAEERIVQILKEAQTAMASKQNSDHRVNPTWPISESSGHAEVCRQPADSGTNSSEAIVSKIYEEELIKLAKHAELSGNIAEYSLYKAELHRLMEKRGYHSPSSTSDRSDELQEEPEDLSLDNKASLHKRASSSSTAIHLASDERSCTECPASERSAKDRALCREKSDNSRDLDSPLQQMQNIANQFLSTSQAHLLQQKPLKQVLPPISQEQFDKYTSLSTEDLVKRVKELLSQFSISQRLFGENVLGLSQGSVSDLLARPKPWAMLTQKGREPFIRMKIFTEDPEAVKKLMSNQYKVHQDYKVPSEYKVPQDYKVPSERPHPRDLPDSTDRVSRAASDTDVWLPTMVPNPLAGIVQTPSIIELAAATGELDTLGVTSRVKDVLQFHNIGQKLFGEAVLGLSQGSVSDMLSKPKPWHLLSLKGREPFVRMHLWLSDPLNVVRLKSYQAEIRAFRRRSGSLGNLQDESHYDHSSHYVKKPRYSFTEDQKLMLKQAFQQDPYPTSIAIDTLAQRMDLSSKTVINWFHNHRMRSKQQNRDENGKRINGLYIKQETVDSNFLDHSSQHSFSMQASVYSGDSQKSESPDSTDPSSPSAEKFFPVHHGRKRKSANPQYVSAGAMLLRHSSADGGDSDNENDMDAEQDSEGETGEIVKNKIARLEQRVKAADLGWEDEEEERREWIQKLEKNLNNGTSEDDWEF